MQRACSRAVLAMPRPHANKPNVHSNHRHLSQVGRCPVTTGSWAMMEASPQRPGARPSRAGGDMRPMCQHPYNQQHSTNAGHMVALCKWHSIVGTHCLQRTQAPCLCCRHGEAPAAASAPAVQPLSARSRAQIARGQKSAGAEAPRCAAAGLARWGRCTCMRASGRGVWCWCMQLASSPIT